MNTNTQPSDARRRTIGFDLAPGPCGPGRYVTALVRGLDQRQWNVIFPIPPPSGAEAGVQPAPSSHPTQPGQPPARKRRLGSALVRRLPESVRYLAGFATESWRVSRRLAAERVDLFHAQNTGCEEVPIGCRWGGARRVLGTLHVDATFDPRETRDHYVQRCLEWLSNCCLHQAIAVSEATKRDWMRKTRLREEQIAVIHNGIDPARVCRQQSRRDARSALKLPPDAIILGGMGRLDGVKGFEYLIEALALLTPESPQLVLAIAGLGPLAETLVSQAAARGLAERVVLVGYCQDVNLFLDACDVFVLSSLSEALPFALLEAMAHELPAVGTTVGGVPEVIVPGETGFLTPARDGAALAQAIRPLLESADLRQRLGRAGRERIVKHFHETDMVRKTLDIYRQMLKFGGP